MDPITLAIVAGISSGLTNVGEQGIIDAYNALKELLKRKFGGESAVVQAVDGVEANPDSKGHPIILSEEMKKSKADTDPDLLKAAEALQSQLKATRGGQTNINLTVTGDSNITSGTGSITVNKPLQ